MTPPPETLAGHTAGPAASDGPPGATPTERDRAQPPPDHATWTGAVVFDMDGVLVLTSDVHVRVWDEYFQQIGYDPGPQGASAVLGRRALDVIAQVRPADPPDVRAATADRLESYSHEVMLADPPRLADGAERLLADLTRAGAPLALATSATREGVELVLGDVTTCFHVIISAEDVRRGKPDPEIYLTAATRLDVEPRRCTVVEDTPAGVLAARGAGMSVIAVEGTVGREALDEAGADRVFSSLAAVRVEDLCRPVS